VCTLFTLMVQPVTAFKAECVLDPVDECGYIWRGGDWLLNGG